MAESQSEWLLLDKGLTLAVLLTGDGRMSIGCDRTRRGVGSSKELSDDKADDEGDEDREYVPPRGVIV